MSDWLALPSLGNRPVIRAALGLMLAGAAARVVDAAYRIAVARLAGPTAVGLLQMSFTVYAFALGLATLGLGPAVARTVAAGANGHWRQAGDRQTLTPVTPPSVIAGTATRLALPAAAAAAVLTFSLAPWLSQHVLADPRTLLPLRILPLGLLAAGFCTVQRGLCQGQQRMGPLALAQVVEPAFRLMLMLSAFTLLPPLITATGTALPPELAAAVLASAVVVGETVECTTITLAARRTAARVAKSTRGATAAGRQRQLSGLPRFNPTVAARLLTLAFPVILSQFLFSTVAGLEAAIIPRRLELLGFSVAGATRRYGQLFGMALPFLFFPMLAVVPIGSVLLPAVAEASGDPTGGTLGAPGRSTTRRFRGRVRGRLYHRVCLAVLGTLLVAAGAVVVFLLFPRQLAALVGGGPEVASLIPPLALWAPFCYLDFIGSTILVGLGRTRAALVDALLASTVRLAGAYFFVPLPSLELRGALLAMTLADALATTLHFLRLYR